MAEETAQEATMTQEEHTAEVVAARKETMEKNRKARDVERRPPAAIKDEQMHHERDRADLAAAADALYPPIKPWSGRGAADFRRGVADAIAGKPAADGASEFYRFGYDYARGFDDAGAGKPAAGRGASKEYRGGYRKGRALRDKRDNVNP